MMFSLDILILEHFSLRFYWLELLNSLVKSTMNMKEA